MTANPPPPYSMESSSVPVYSTPGFPPISDTVLDNPLGTSYSYSVLSQPQLTSTSSRPLSETIQFPTVGPATPFPALLQIEPEPVAPTTGTIEFQLPAFTSFLPESPAFPSSFEPVQNTLPPPPSNECEPRQTQSLETPSSHSQEMQVVAPHSGGASILQPLLPSIEMLPPPPHYEVANYNKSGYRANIYTSNQLQMSGTQASGYTEVPLAVPYGGLAGQPQLIITSNRRCSKRTKKLFLVLLLTVIGIGLALTIAQFRGAFRTSSKGSKQLQIKKSYNSSPSSHQTSSWNSGYSNSSNKWSSSDISKKCVLVFYSERTLHLML